MEPLQSKSGYKEKNEMVVKMCDMPVRIAIKVFEYLNLGKVRVSCISDNLVIVTNTEPKDLSYPEGWYYANGTFRNKHTSTTGNYSEVEMTMENGERWRNKAVYCYPNY